MLLNQLSMRLSDLQASNQCYKPSNLTVQCWCWTINNILFKLTERNSKLKLNDMNTI